MEIRLKDAKLLFMQGAIVGWRLDTFYSEWILFLKMRNGTEQKMYAHRGEIRYFKTVNAGISAVQSVGFEVLSLSA